MVEVIKSYERKARIEHRCDYCGGKIIKGEVYKNDLLKDSSIYMWKSHLRCEEIVDTLKMRDEYTSDGISGNDFQQFIRERFHELEPNKDLYNIPFSDRLDFVCNYYLSK